MIQYVMRYCTCLILLCTMILMSSCQKDNDDDTISVPATGKLFFSCVLDSTQNIYYEHGVSNYRNEGALEKEGNWAVQESVFSYFNHKLQLGLSMTKTLDATDTNMQYAEFFSEGEKDFALPVAEGEYSEGIRVFYLDEEGVRWATDMGNAIQDSSRIEIINHIEYNEDQTVLGSENYITSATIKCVLYNGEGDSLLLTDGAFKGLTAVFE